MLYLRLYPETPPQGPPCTGVHRDVAEAPRRRPERKTTRSHVPSRLATVHRRVQAYLGISLSQELLMSNLSCRGRLFSPLVPDTRRDSLFRCLSHGRGSDLGPSIAQQSDAPNPRHRSQVLQVPFRLRRSAQWSGSGRRRPASSRRTSRWANATSTRWPGEMKIGRRLLRLVRSATPIRRSS
jgi:hypothetical protein